MKRTLAFVIAYLFVIGSVVYLAVNSLTTLLSEVDQQKIDKEIE
jgi:hypothetical protein